MRDLVKRWASAVSVAAFLLMVGGGSAIAATDGFPVTVENCGRELTFERPPQRAITGYQQTIELMLALGLEDSIIARQGFPRERAPLLPEQEAAFNAIPEISSGKDGDQTATKEVTLSLEPDFFFAGGPYNVNGEQGLATEEDLERNGAQVFYMDCASHGTADAVADEGALTQIDIVYKRIGDLGKIFGITDRAETLIARMKADIADVQERVQGLPEPRVFVYAGDYLGPDGPLPGQSDRYFDLGVAGGMNMLGIDQPQYPEVSREAVAAFDPEVFVTAGPIEEATKNGEYLRKTFPNSPAVRDDRIVIGLASIDFTAGIRNARTIRQLAEAFHPEAFA